MPARATIVIPSLLALAYKVIGDPQVALFAVFGGFATLLIASFGGTRRDKLAAHLVLALTGSVALIIGTLVSRLEGWWLASAAVAIADLSGVKHGFWVVLGTLSVLRTSASATGATAWRGLAGTVVGFVVGVVLFNLLAPVGWKVGLLRIEDVAIGCAVSFAVGVLLWPRGVAGVPHRPGQQAAGQGRPVDAGQRLRPAAGRRGRAGPAHGTDPPAALVALACRRKTAIIGVLPVCRNGPDAGIGHIDGGSRENLRRASLAISKVTVSSIRDRQQSRLHASNLYFRHLARLPS